MRATGSGDSGETKGFARRVLLVAAVAFVTVAVVLLLVWAFHALLLAFAGVLVAVFLYRLSAVLGRWTHMPYWLCLSIVGIVVLGLMAGGVWLVEARLTAELSGLERELPLAWRRLTWGLGQTRLGAWLMEHGRNATAAVQQQLLGSGFHLASSATLIFGEAFAVVFIGIFGAVNPQLYIRGLLRLVPMENRPQGRRIAQEIGEILWWWLLGQFAAMIFLGLTEGLGLWVLGIRLALSLAVMAAVFSFIPNFGPVAAAIPAMLLALLQSPLMVLWVALLYIFLDFLHNHLVIPLVQQKTVRLSPIALMMGQVFPYYFDGLLGMAVAPPLIAAGIRVFQILYLEDYLHDPMQRTAGFWPDGAE